MPMWPEFEVLERDGRLLVGRSPRVRRGNRVGLGAALVVGVPLLLVFVWIGANAPSWMIAIPAGLSVAGGLWCFSQALSGDFELDEGHDIVFDAAGDRVLKRGAVVCALRDIVSVEVTSPPIHYNNATDQASSAPGELALFITRSDAHPPGGSERIVLLTGPSSDLELPGGQIRSYLSQALPPWASRTT